MRQIGFSSGALAFGDFHRALAMLQRRGLQVLELSALREQELAPLVQALDELKVEEQFKYVSLHVPSRVAPSSERQVVGLLEGVAARGWPLVVHPGVLHSPELWKPFGDLLCIENMDKRSPIARTCGELAPYFELFPRARFCLDLGHARQIDLSMVEAYQMLMQFRTRLQEIHLSEVTFASRHARISITARLAFQSIARLIPEGTPIVLESVLADASEIDSELRAAQRALSVPERPYPAEQPGQFISAE